MPNLLTPEERCFIKEEYEVWVQQQTNLALFDGHFFSQKSFKESFIMPVTERLCTTYREGVPLNCHDQDAIAGYCAKLHQWPTGTRCVKLSIAGVLRSWYTESCPVVSTKIT
jgi:hypothetical protein